MISAHLLALPDYSLPLILETDASARGIGVILIQQGRPLAYLSKGLAPKHQGLSMYVKELLAIVLATQKWFTYLQGHHFLIRIDYQSLKFLLDQRLSTLLQQKWLAKLMGLDNEIIYKKGKENIVADALSRQLEVQNGSMINDLSAVQPQWLDEIVESYNGDCKVHKIIEGLVVKDVIFNKFSDQKGLLRHEGKFMWVQLGIYGKVSFGSFTIAQPGVTRARTQHTRRL